LEKRQTTRIFILTIIALLALSINAGALSADEAVAIISVKNNYLMNGETPTVAKELITYQSNKYLIGAAQKSNVITCYIPIRDSTGTIATMPVEIREIIKTAIVYTKMSELKSNTTPANWLFSYSTKSSFYNLSKDFSDKSSAIITVKTELEKLELSEATPLIQKAQTAKLYLADLAKQSKTLAEQVEKGRVYEENFLNTPDTNQLQKYETNYKDLFTAISEYKKNFDALDQALSQLSQGIGALETNKLTVDQKRSLQSLLTMPTNARSLSSFFNQTDQMRTLIEAAFNEAKNSDNYATTLEARKTRNEAWLAMYGTNEPLLKIDPSFQTLEKTVSYILADDAKDKWKNTEARDALESAWNSAIARFNNSEYEKAKEYALTAQKKVQAIINDGVIPEEPPINNDLIIKIIGGLIVLTIGIFVFEKYSKKKKVKEDDEYESP
jgi:hypothetical protein